MSKYQIPSSWKSNTVFRAIRLQRGHSQKSLLFWVTNAERRASDHSAQGLASDIFTNISAKIIQFAFKLLAIKKIFSRNSNYLYSIPNRYPFWMCYWLSCFIHTVRLKFYKAEVTKRILRVKDTITNFSQFGYMIYFRIYPPLYAS